MYADFETGKIWAFKYLDGRASEHRELANPPLKIVGFAEEANGELLILDYTGQMHRLLRAPPDVVRPPQDFPRKLSETGLFASTVEHHVASGLIPYSVNSPLWSDNCAQGAVYCRAGPRSDRISAGQCLEVSRGERADEDLLARSGAGQSG